jgi:hypothetical protein
VRARLEALAEVEEIGEGRVADRPVEVGAELPVAVALDDEEVRLLPADGVGAVDADERDAPTRRARERDRVALQLGEGT